MIKHLWESTFQTLATAVACIHLYQFQNVESKYLLDTYLSTYLVFRDELQACIKNFATEILFHWSNCLLVVISTDPDLEAWHNADRLCFEPFKILRHYIGWKKKQKSRKIYLPGKKIF